MSDDCSIFHQCLYFTANSLCRVITRMTEEEFAVIGLSPSYAFLLMLAEQEPGIVQKDLADALNPLSVRLQKLTQVPSMLPMANLTSRKFSHSR